jgi:hypothetical protein
MTLDNLKQARSMFHRSQALAVFWALSMANVAAKTKGLIEGAIIAVVWFVMIPIIMSFLIAAALTGAAASLTIIVPILLILVGVGILFSVYEQATS